MKTLFKTFQIIGQMQADLEPFGTEDERVRDRLVATDDTEFPRVVAGRPRRQPNDLPALEPAGLHQVSRDQDLRDRGFRGDRRDGRGERQAGEEEQRRAMMAAGVRHR